MNVGSLCGKIQADEKINLMLFAIFVSSVLKIYFRKFIFICIS